MPRLSSTNPLTIVQPPECLLVDLSILCGLQVSRRYSRQVDKCLRPASKHPGATKRSRSPHRPMSPPSRHPGTRWLSRCLHRNARMLSPIYATWECGAGGWENTRDCELQGKALHTRIRWIRKKRKQESKVQMGFTLKSAPCQAPTNLRRSRTLKPLLPPTTVLPLLPPKHRSGRVWRSGQPD